MKSFKFYIIIIILAPIVSFSQNPEFVVLGNQTWSNINLSVDTFQNGNIIEESKNKEEWLKAGYKRESSWCYYEFDEKNAHLGKLYNYYALTDSRNIAPKGWKVPTFFDYFNLIKFLDPLITLDYFENKGSIAGGSLKIKDSEYWLERDCDQIDSKFNAIPSGGYRPSLSHPQNDWDKAGECSRFWCITDWKTILDASGIDEAKKSEILKEGQSEESAIVFRLNEWCKIDADDDPKLNGYSIRLIKIE